MGKKFSKGELEVLYTQHTDSQIGEMFGMSGEGVAYHRKKLGIPTTTIRERRDLSQRKGLPTLGELTPVLLKSLYQQMGDRQIAARYGVKKPAIARLRKKWGIVAISKSERATKKDLLTQDQKEVIIGTLLGDGHLFERGVLKVVHSHSQFDYLRHIHNMLSTIARPLFYEETESEDSGEMQYGFGFRTVQHEWLRELRAVFYPKGTRKYPTVILRGLTVQSLAYWYFDDGHLDSGLPSFALGDTTLQEAEEIVRVVGEQFGIKTYLMGTSAQTSCKIMGIRAISSALFFSLIAPYASSSVLYKIPRKFWPPGVVPKVPINTKGEKHIPIELRREAKRWGSVSLSDRERIEQEIFEFWRREGFPHSIIKPQELQAIHRLEVDQVLQGGVLKERRVGQSSCHALMPHIWEARSFQSKRSPMQIFSDDVSLRKAIRALLGMGRVPNPSQLRGALRFLTYSGVYNFRPSAAKVLVDKFCPPGGTVFDPCAGYGGRMMGVVLSSAYPRYIGCEPQNETFTRLHRMADWIGSYVQGAKDRIQLHNVTSEDFEFPCVDMVLTSPPYWKREIYGDSERLAGNRYSTYESWLKEFWEEVVRKSVLALNPGGWVVLNVDDFKIGGVVYPLIQDTIDICERLPVGKGEVVRYAMPKFKDRENHEKVLCWPRVGQPKTVTIGEQGVQFSHCTSCGKVIPLGEKMICPACSSKKITCTVCGLELVGASSRTLYCVDCRKALDAKRAKEKRKQRRATNPLAGVRDFICQSCDKEWQTSLKGSFKYCPECKEERELSKRRKTCQYRHCGEAFVDDSKQNSMRFCCPEHRRREKMFRSGKITDVSQFRSEQEIGVWTCSECGEQFKAVDRRTVCLDCRQKLRSKKCRRCGGAFLDQSQNNTRRYCSDCVGER